MVFLFQHETPPKDLHLSQNIKTTDSFEVCLHHIKNLTQGTKCNVVVAKQAFIQEEPLPNRCKGNPNSVQKRLRVQMQTFAVGRTLHWALHFFGAHRYYIRARIDGPWCIPGDMPKEPFIGMNTYKVMSDEEGSSYFPSDRFAIVPWGLRDVYFDAWKVWMRVDCGDPCIAGRGNRTANKIRWSSGECPLSAWMNRYWDSFRWVSVDGVGDPILRVVNGSHTGFQHGDGKIDYQSAVEVMRETEKKCGFSDRVWNIDMRKYKCRHPLRPCKRE